MSNLEAIKSKNYLPSILGGPQVGKPSAASAFNGRSAEGEATGGFKTQGADSGAPGSPSAALSTGNW